MIVASVPATAFVVAKPQVLFQILVVTFDAPAHVSFGNQLAQCHVRRQRGKKGIQRFNIVDGPNHPLHLLLGGPGLKVARKQLADLATEFDAWKAITLNADYPQ
ncbi:short-chain dehydrogenase [Pandoraea terrae]|uniref:Short-chain dehydrogenase n=1 Tax=Pandoraea terrae TaxID=1537710 RepID=A0A5E4U5E4_9BURK|nr:short-chain dehydrogenase [Pandoraea terrae]